ncbi:hypothetical protein [Riemerella anatipestifer]|uniref:hypothetical protein n=1 Tax=Riemerella anatipestifer TaxID=34085 RepID=UPI0021AA12A2|nr:hypothetical protein [Riemerella anatipestifer]
MSGVLNLLRQRQLPLVFVLNPVLIKGKERKKRQKEQVEKELLLTKFSNKIAEIQNREFISVSEAAIMYGISKDTVYRMR